MKNKMNENNMIMGVTIMYVITGLILSFWIICVSAIMIPVLLDEAKISSESVISSSEVESVVAETRVNTETETDGPRVFRYVGDWNSSENGNVNGNED